MNTKDFIILKTVVSNDNYLYTAVPIIQDGKLIGAVTHVLVNNPTKCDGIFSMLDAAG